MLPPLPTIQTPADVVRTGNLEIRAPEYQLLAGSRRVGLTVREFQTFFVLAERPDRVVPREIIYELVWGAKMVHRDRSVDVFVRKVRRKLAAASPGWEYIHTHFGVGYRFFPEQAAALPPDLPVIAAPVPDAAGTGRPAEAAPPIV